MAIGRTLQGFSSLILSYVDLFIAFLLLCFATITFFWKSIIQPVNTLLIRLDAFLLNVSTRRVSNVRRVLQLEDEAVETGTSSHREVSEAESFRGASTLSLNSEVVEKKDANLEGDEAATMTKNLQNALIDEKSAHAALRRELQEERRAAASAAEEAMAMILRLQEEKAAIEMEARQYRAVAEGKSKHEEEEIEILEDILIRREREKHVLEKEVEAYAQIFGLMGNEGQDGNYMNDVINAHTIVDKTDVQIQEKDVVTTEKFTSMPSSSDGNYGSFDIKSSKKNASDEINKKNKEDLLENRDDNNVHDVLINKKKYYLLP